MIGENHWMAKTKLDQVVYEHIVTQINNGELLVREHVTEQNIADELEVSRTPVRKAFERLVDDNYLENMENTGVRVKMQSLSSKDFQERMDVFERLINHYLFDLEKQEIRFETERLYARIEELKQKVNGDIYEFEEVEYAYWVELLKYSTNEYSKKIIIRTVRDGLFDDGEIYQILQKSETLKIKHFLKLTEYLEESNYALARREVRILLNQLRLNVIETGLTY